MRARGITWLESLLALATVTLLVLASRPLVAGDPPRLAENCLTTLKSIGTSIAIYAGDWDDRLPPAAWMDATAHYRRTPELAHCPAVESGIGYAFHRQHLGVKLARIPGASTKMVFDSRLLHTNAVSGPETMPQPPRHERANNIVFADGHAASQRP